MLLLCSSAEELKPLHRPGFHHDRFLLCLAFVALFNLCATSSIHIKCEIRDASLLDSSLLNPVRACRHYPRAILPSFNRTSYGQVRADLSHLSVKFPSIFAKFTPRSRQRDNSVGSDSSKRMYVAPNPNLSHPLIVSSPAWDATFPSHPLLSTSSDTIIHHASGPDRRRLFCFWSQVSLRTLSGAFMRGRWAQVILSRLYSFSAS